MIRLLVQPSDTSQEINESGDGLLDSTQKVIITFTRLRVVIIYFSSLVVIYSYVSLWFNFSDLSKFTLLIDVLAQWLSSKESACNARATGDMGSVPGLGRSPGGWHSNPLQYSCLENPKNRGAWWATVHAVTKSQT